MGLSALVRAPAVSCDSCLSASLNLGASLPRQGSSFWASLVAVNGVVGAYRTLVFSEWLKPEAHRRIGGGVMTSEGSLGMGLCVFLAFGPKGRRLKHALLASSLAAVPSWHPL